MKFPVNVHRTSLILGLVVGTVCFLAMGQSSVTTTTLGAMIRIEYMPHPRDMIRVQGGTPYVVPPGRLFVLTGLGTNRTGIGGYTARQVSLLSNGARVASALATLEEGNGASIKAVPSGLALIGGSTLDVLDQDNQPSADYFAWGYLANE